ncbi:MAG: SBBP repeat-containing protein [Candidatus Thorarchaeota archaeon]
MRLAVVLITLVLFVTPSVLFQSSIAGHSYEMSQSQTDTLSMRYDMSTYYGGSSQDTASTVIFDSEGNIIVVGSTLSNDLPMVNAHQDTYGGGRDAYILKLDSSYDVVFCTYYGGSGEEYAEAVVTDDDNNIIISGRSESTDLPVPNGLQTQMMGNGDAFVAKFSPTGVLEYGTYIGGSGEDEWLGTIIIDENDNWILAGPCDTDDMNTTTDVFQETYGGGARDIMILSLSSDGQDVEFLTYFGADGSENCADITFDQDGNIVLIGYAELTGVTTEGVYQETYAGGPGDVVVAKISRNAETLIWSTMLGGSLWDFGGDVTVDSDDTIVVSGYSESSDFPLQNELYGNENERDTFLARLSEDGAILQFSSLLGGNGEDYCYGMEMLENGSIAICSFTTSNNMPTVNPLQANKSGGQDAYFALYNSDLDALTYASYIGGSGDETCLSLYTFNDELIAITGYTSSNDFPLQDPIQSERAGNQDIFLVILNTTQIEPAPPQIPIDFSIIGIAVVIVAVVIIGFVFVRKSK